ncbi:hypothetical protein QV01_02500 [Gallibacterium genomosp. 3]|uniref:Beta-methylgalactoside transporter inner membrane component n=1 Tax=Gallibacterium genomosp. 3 TaxID=505345 RepID=A0A1A7NSM1_9PAST|nr:hypothetical protein [Gallibacterium genomosp. 3]OBW93232.1 hypothetical protein QV01_02500 [Gallibacterium genomosp. 3]
MSINFVRILQESSYFVRNRYPIVVTFTVLYALNTLIFQLIMEANGGLEQLQTTPNSISSSVIFASFFNLIFSVILNIWFILTIDQVSTNRIGDIFSCIPTVLQKLIGFIGYNCLLILALMPFIMGISIGAVSGGISLFIGGVVCLLVSGYLLTRIALLPYAYLLEPGRKGLRALYQLVNYRQQYKVMVVYLLLVYLVPILFSNLLVGLLGANLLVLSTLITSFINLFSLIFAYRFYRIFIKANSL